MIENTSELLAVLMFAGAFLILLTGFPVAFGLMGAAVAFAALGVAFGDFAWPLMSSAGGRLVDLMTNETLVAVPLFIFMGVVLERSRIAEELLITMGQAFGKLRGGLGISVIVVGAILSASTGIVGATVVTMGLISLPAMTRAGYDRSLSSGIICASGTLAQLIPPSTVLILLGITLQNANTQANLRMGQFGGSTLSITDLFAAAFLPGLLLVGLYILWIALAALLRPASCPAITITADERRDLWRRALVAVLPPIALIVLVLGSIITGTATATESSAVGALGACLIAALRGRFRAGLLTEVARSTFFISTMIFAILIGATIFAMVFRGLGGDHVVERFVTDLPGGVNGAIFFVLAVVFFLGFLIDTFEIIFIVMPIFAPVLIVLGADPILFGVLVAIVLQTSYLTPPFGFAIFYLQGVAKDLSITTIYRGVLPFVALQLLAMALVWFFPALATWLPAVLL
jgi:tripartite ATP-independent transporter DctM subunit